jgi:hypothetical protein
VCDLETSRIGAPYIYDISNLRVNNNESDESSRTTVISLEEKNGAFLLCLILAVMLYIGWRVKRLYILYLGINCRGVISFFAVIIFPLGKFPLYTLNRRQDVY